MHEEFTPDFIAKFWSKVNVCNTFSCWNWRGTTREGYGYISHNKKSIGAHRIAYEMFFGPIPAGLFACHRCDVRTCCNPHHIFAATNAENQKDAVAKHGHWNPPPKLSGANHPSKTRPGYAIKGVQHHMAKLTDDDIRFIRARAAAGRGGQALLAKQFGMSQATISEIVLRKIWKHVD